MKKFPFAKARALVAGAVAALIVVGLLTHAATGTWSALGIESIAAICPVGALEVMLGSRQLLSRPLILLLIVVVGVLLVGKAFCSWACPVPWLQKLFRPGKKNHGEAGEAADSTPNDTTEADGTAHAVSASIIASADALGTGLADDANGSRALAGNAVATPTAPSIHNLSCNGHCTGCALPAIGGSRDGLQLDARHFALLGALGSAAIFGFPVFCLLCPIGLTAATFVGVFHLLQFNETSWGLLVFPAILLLEVVFFRKWCARICPIGALLSLISSGNHTFRPRVDGKKCLRTKGIDCRACTTACPEQLDPHSKHIPECIKCGACATACPANAISLRLLTGKQANEGRRRRQCQG